MRAELRRFTRALPTLGLAGLAILMTLMSGCATHPAKTPRVTQIAQNPPSTTPATDRPDLQPGNNNGTASAAELDALDPPRPKHFVPHHWPAPEDDLWSKIRAGFELKPDEQRRSVRIWTQYYATHTNHLSLSLQRARPFLWHVVKQVEARHMPTEIALLPIVESGYNASAKSYVGASGLWQFMPGTADNMALPRDWWYDGRDDPIASTDAALDYLQSLDDRYGGDWLLALAAYNAGPGRVDAAIARAQAENASTSYWDLELPEETSEYVPQLLALRRIMMTPARFGVDWPALANKPTTRLVKLPGQTELKVAADMLDMSEADLRELNPAMRRWASDPHGDAELLVPAAKASAFQTRLARISPSRLIQRQTHTVRRGEVLSRIATHYGVSVASLRQANEMRSDRILVGQKLDIPRGGKRGEKVTPAEPTQTYVVQSGDTLWNIADRYNVSVASLRSANGSRATSLHPGDKLSIPGSAKPPAPSTYVVKNGDSLWSIARGNSVSVADLKRWNRLDPHNPLRPGRTIALDGPAPLPDYYEVEPGDSLWSIASRFSMQVATLRSLNDMSAKSTIRPGERLRLQPSESS